MSLLLPMVVFAFVGAVTPGPVNLLATNIALNQGMASALRHVLGASFAYALVVALTSTSLQGISTLNPNISFAMQALGSAFLLYLSAKIFTAASALQQNSTEQTDTSPWWSGALLQLLNPKAWMVASSGASLFVVGQQHAQQAMLAFTLVSLFICMLGVGLWALLGQVLSRQLANPRLQSKFNKLMAAALALCVVAIWI